MEPASEQFRPSDVTFWGIVALACGAIAIVSTNVGALLPASVVNSLHATRIEGAGIEQLQAQLTRLEIESQDIFRDNEQLRARFSLAEMNQGAVTRRVGALEVSLPTLLEGQHTSPEQIDRSINTAGIGDVPTQTFDAEGGSVIVSQKPMTAFDGYKGGAFKQPLPALPAAAPVLSVANKDAFGLAVGAEITDANAEAAWKDISLKMGALLIGLGPLVAEETGQNGKRLIVGPLPDMAQAADLCQRIEKVAIPCQPVPFAGKPL